MLSPPDLEIAHDLSTMWTLSPQLRRSPTCASHPYLTIEMQRRRLASACVVSSRSRGRYCDSPPAIVQLMWFSP